MAEGDNNVRIKALEERFESFMKCNETAHAKLHDKIDRISEIVVRNDEKYNSIITLLTEVRQDISSLKGKSGKRWEAVVTGVIVAGLSTGLGYFIGQLAR